MAVTSLLQSSKPEKFRNQKIPVPSDDSVLVFRDQLSLVQFSLIS